MRSNFVSTGQLFTITLIEIVQKIGSACLPSPLFFANARIDLLKSKITSKLLTAKCVQADTSGVGSLPNNWL